MLSLSANARRRFFRALAPLVLACVVAGNSAAAQTPSANGAAESKRADKATAANVAAEKSAAEKDGAAKRLPNVVLILADDLGFSDLGCYGGEIRTPNLDALAAGGLRFTQFYNCARCCPTRACLLTGQYPHMVDFPAMNGSLPERCVTIPEMMRSAGYRTLMAGKWHLGRPNPVQRGFDEFYGMLEGYGSFWNPKLFTRLPKDRPTRDYAPGKFYATDVVTDYAIDFIHSARESAPQPWFLYLAYTAPHFPLHAPPEEIKKYEHIYEAGWDKIRAARYERQKQSGLLVDDPPLTGRSVIPPNRVATPHGWANKENPAWESLDSDPRADLARRMAVFAGMVDRMDQNIGRVVADLREHHELDNTLILFLSDNGACAEWDPFGFDESSGPANKLHTGASLDEIGAPGSYISYGSAWANACNTPFRLYKHYCQEGGICTPLIVHWPAQIQAKGEFRRQPGHVLDLMTTLVDIAGATYPAELNGHKILPMPGRNLAPAFAGEAPRRDPLFWEHEGNAAVRADNWKLVRVGAQGPWELYDLATDRLEMHDLAADQPKRVQELAAKWKAWYANCETLMKSKQRSAGGK